MRFTEGILLRTLLLLPGAGGVQVFPVSSGRLRVSKCQRDRQLNDQSKISHSDFIVKHTSDEPYSPLTPPTARASGSWRLRIALLAIVAAGAGFLYWQFGHYLSLESLAKHEQQLQNFKSDHPALVYVAAFGIYVAVTGMSLPGAAVLSVAYAWFFGFVPGVILISFASTAGACVAFLMSRYFFGRGLQKRYAARLEGFNKGLEDEGAFYLFTLRLIPAVPFFIINVVMGLTRLPLRTFWIVSQVGMLPGTAAYVYAGSSIGTLQELSDKGLKGLVSTNLLIAFALLGTLPLILKRGVGWLNNRKS